MVRLLPTRGGFNDDFLKLSEKFRETLVGFDKSGSCSELLAERDVNEVSSESLRTMLSGI